MQLGMIGLGRMGANLVRRLMRHGHECVVWDHTPAHGRALEDEGANGAATRGALGTKRTTLVAPGDIIIDGGNSSSRDDIERSDALRPQGIHYLDVGTSGGVFGLERGFCLMIGGNDETVAHPHPTMNT